MGYNRYRHRHYNISKMKARNYAQQMDNLESTFDKEYPEWQLSTMKDSCYRDYGSFEVRISNHSAEHKHDIQNGYLIVNIKGSKLDFPKIIDNIVPRVLKDLRRVNLKNYRFINVINNRIDLYYKGFKTKKDSIML